MKSITILLAVAVTMMASCNVAKKTQHKQSTEINTTDQAGIDTTKKETITENKTVAGSVDTGSSESTETKKELTVDFEPRNDGITADDYVKKDIGGVQVKTNQPSNINLKPDGSIEIKGNVKKLNYRETGKTEKKDTTHAVVNTQENKSATVENKGIDTSKHEVAIVATESSSSKFTWRPSPLLLIFGILGLIVFGYCAWRFRWFGFLFKRKDKDDKNKNTLTSVKYSPPKPPADA